MNEDFALAYTKSSDEDLTSYISFSENKQKKKDEKTVFEMVKIKEKVEVDIRTAFGDCSFSGYKLSELKRKLFTACKALRRLTQWRKSQFVPFNLLLR